MKIGGSPTELGTTQVPVVGNGSCGPGPGGGVATPAGVERAAALAEALGEGAPGVETVALGVGVGAGGVDEEPID